MKRWIMPIAVVGLAFVGLASAADPEPKAAAAAPSGVEPTTEADKTFYTLGLFLASRMQLPNFNMTPAELAMVQAGLTDGALNHPPKVDMQTYLPKLKEIADQRVSASKATTAAAEKKKGKEFLESIAAKPGIRKTGTGLLMETISEGTGTGPGPSDTVKVNYKGTLIDGKPFDSGEITRALTGVIACWTEALQFMKPGGKAKLYCPSDIAYKDAGHPPDIPPGATLIFEVELVEVVK